MTESDKCEYTFYTFICNDPNITDCYVGSTKAFRQRKRNHKSNCNLKTSKSYNVKIYQTIRANGGWDSWEMKPIDTKICSRLEARIHETKLMEERHATLNCMKAYTSDEQKQEAISANKKAYYEQNKDKLLAYQKEYNQQNKETISTYQKEYQKEYYHQNKEVLIAYQKEYRAKKKQQNELINMIKDDLTSNSDELYSHQPHTEHT